MGEHARTSHASTARTATSSDLFTVLFHAAPVTGALVAGPLIKRSHVLADLVSPPFPKGRCQTCGYDLTGNQSGVCLECGDGV